MGLGCGDHRDVVVDKGPGKPRRRTVGAVSRSGVWRGRRSTLTGHPHRCRGVATGCIGSRGRTHQVLDEIGQHLRGIESGRAGGDGGGAGGVAVADRCPAGDGSPDTALERHPRPPAAISTACAVCSNPAAKRPWRRCPTWWPSGAIRRRSVCWSRPGQHDAEGVAGAGQAPAGDGRPRRGRCAARRCVCARTARQARHRMHRSR